MPSARSRPPLAFADAREIVVHFEHDQVPYRLILPYQRSLFLLEAAAPDEGDRGRPWIFRWNRLARGQRQADTIIRHERIHSAEDLSPGQLDAVRRALHFVENGPDLPIPLLRH